MRHCEQVHGSYSRVVLLDPDCENQCSMDGRFEVDGIVAPVCAITDGSVPNTGDSSPCLCSQVGAGKAEICDEAVGRIVSLIILEKEM